MLKDQHRSMLIVQHRAMLIDQPLDLYDEQNVGDVSTELQRYVVESSLSELRLIGKLDFLNSCPSTKEFPHTASLLRISVIHFISISTYIRSVFLCISSVFQYFISASLSSTLFLRPVSSSLARTFPSAPSRPTPLDC